MNIEWEYKRQIAPAEAAKTAIFEDAIREAFDQKGVSADPRSPSLLFLTDHKDIMDAVSPNQLDAAQADALFMYQACRYHREALSVLLDGLKEINRAVDKDGPRPSGPSR